MAQPGFYSNNLGRWYPFMPPAHEDELVRSLPRSAIVDAFAVMSARSEFTLGAGDRIVLKKVFRFGPIFHFVFYAELHDPFGARPNMLDKMPVMICRHESDQEFAASYAAARFVEEDFLSELLSEPVSFTTEPGAAQPLWYMHLVSGSMEELAQALPSESAWSGSLELMPTLIQCQPRLLSKVSIGNVPRTRVRAPQGCRAPCFAAPPPVLWREPDIPGNELIWGDGIQSAIRIDPQNQDLHIVADTEAGTCRPCDEVPLHGNERPAIGETLLTGGPACHEVIRSINGTGGPHIQIEAGPGIRVTPLPERHRLIVEIRHGDSMICDPGAQTPADPRPDTVNPNPCQCGPASS